MFAEHYVQCMNNGKENKGSTDARTQWQADRTMFQRVYFMTSPENPNFGQMW